MITRPHSYARYKLDGCRCNRCGYAVAQYNDAREHAIRRGQWKPYVDAEPVRQHIRRLQECGLGLRRIADSAGVDRQRLQAVLRGRPERGTGPQEKIRPEVAAAVLAVEPTLENLAAHLPIDATGTRRRLQALIAGGWPQAHLASRLGILPGNFGRALTGDRVIVRTARAVRVLYDELWRADPTKHGASPAGVTRARRYAAAHQWAPVGAWDDDAIDDPAAFPDWTGRCGAPGGYDAHRKHGLLPVCEPCRAARIAHRHEQKAAKEAAA